jgi:glutamate/tyrosine decarboxylase-like PLP-dependent enzyme
VDRAQTAAAAIERRANWQLFAQPQSNIVCFRLMGADNAALRQTLLENGPQYIVKTVLNGETWFRCTFQNPLTEDSHIEALLDRLEEINASLG